MTAAPVSMPQCAPQRWQIAAGFAILYVVWGTTYLAIRIGVLDENLPPFLFGGARIGAAGLVLLAVQALRGQSLGFSRHDAVGILCGAGFGFFQSPNNVAMISAAPARRSGAATGTLGTARLMGQSAGGALAALMLASFGDAGATVSLATGAVVALIAATVSAMRLWTPRLEPEAVVPVVERKVIR